jgi:endonuclease/exonuclease/phosphatase (EEP) superfamily protein YafD
VRNQQLAVAASHTRGAADGRTLLVGDLNLTPWSPFFTQLKREGQLSDSGLGRGLVGTWQSKVPFLGLMIDHVLTGPRVVPLNRRIGQDLNSDHWPVIVDFALH